MHHALHGSLLWDEALVQLYKLANKLDQSIWIECGKCNARRRFVQALHVLVRPEQPDVPALVLVRLHSLKALKRIVEDACSRVETEILVRSDSRWQPSL